MESIAGVNNWKLTVRREAAGVTILRAATCDPRAALPDALWGLPVTALGDHALAAGAAEVPGETVELYVENRQVWAVLKAVRWTLPNGPVWGTP